jgi:TetR/AcrR family transcriptional regulator, regulator of cefoperazone and chloramphenicol sensitivity
MESKRRRPRRGRIGQEGGAAPMRADGLTTRKELLEAAGAIFAEHGYAKATSKEICERAGANIAAVNYHFGGKDGLYSAVLEEAHHRLVSLETVAAAAHSDVDPRIKLRVLLTRIVSEIERRERGGWELRVLSREVMSQSPLIDGLINNQIAPKAKLVRGVIAEIMALPAEHPAVSRAVISVMGPCIFLIIVNRDLQRKVAPHLDPDPEALVEHMLTFTLAGMRAVARKTRS